MAEQGQQGQQQPPHELPHHPGVGLVVAAHCAGAGEGAQHHTAILARVVERPVACAVPAWLRLLLTRALGLVRPILHQGQPWDVSCLAPWRPWRDLQLVCPKLSGPQASVALAHNGCIAVLTLAGWPAGVASWGSWAAPACCTAAFLRAMIANVKRSARQQ